MQDMIGMVSKRKKIMAKVFTTKNYNSFDMITNYIKTFTFNELVQKKEKSL